MAYQMAATPVT